MVLPKALRDVLGLADGGEVELELHDGVVTISPPTVRKRIEERDGRAVIVYEDDAPPLTDDDIRATLDAVRP
jgi:antitoxin component of MazEF toxin-antitoxin module